jgi:phosphoribosylaminoimidazolecarboxamide formyltransferase/IMP cyclohydrolase
MEDAIENIDIGGPTMIRAAAKNYTDVSVVTDPSDYKKIIEEMSENDGNLTHETRFYLAKKAFQLTARYDAAISNYLGAIENGKATGSFPETFTVQFKKILDLRYGENPHQMAAFFGDTGPTRKGIACARQIHGKDLSFNNILDINSALEITREFHEPAAV